MSLGRPYDSNGPTATIQHRGRRSPDDPGAPAPAIGRQVRFDRTGIGFGAGLWTKKRNLRNRSGDSSWGSRPARAQWGGQDDVVAHARDGEPAPRRSVGDLRYAGDLRADGQEGAAQYRLPSTGVRIPARLHRLRLRPVLPTVGLDPAQRLEFRELLRSLKDTAVVLSTHLVEDVSAICDSVIVMDEGRFLYQGSPGELAEIASDQAPGDSPIERGYMTVLSGHGVPA